MKKKIISALIATTFCFSPILDEVGLLSTSVSANNGIRVNIALNNQTKGGSYNIVLTDSDYNTITKVIPTSGSTAYFEDIEIGKEYMITVTHATDETELWYFGKHTFELNDYGKTLYVKVANTPVSNYTFTGNYSSLEGYTAKIGVAGAYANVSASTIYKGYFENYINPDFEVVDILATFNLNGFVTGDNWASIIVDLDEYLPANYAVVRLDEGNNNIKAIYYNTNSYPIVRLNERMFSINLADFDSNENFAVVELKDSTQVEYTFYNNIEYKIADYTYAGTTYSTNNFSKGGSIPTTGYISAFRNVAIGDVINLDALNISGVTGWYHDIIFKNPVSDTSSVVVTQDILVNGLYPKYSSNSIYNRTYSFIK